jgi:membrane protein YdbS with pleckstrin-like domain
MLVWSSEDSTMFILTAIMLFVVIALVTLGVVFFLGRSIWRSHLRRKALFALKGRSTLRGCYAG